MFTKQDQLDIKEKGIDLAVVEAQVERFKTGFPPIKLTSPAIIGKGVTKVKESSIPQLESYFDKESTQYNLLKFVPASGAASRMFKELFSFMEDNLGNSSQSIEKNKAMWQFFSELHKFSFFYDLEGVVAKSGKTLDELLGERKYAEVLEFLLTEKGLNYGNLPKGLLKFHKYPDGNRIAVEEHLVEAANYCRSNNTCAIHFTVSPEHLLLFKEAIAEVQGSYESKFGVKFKITYSIQKTKTDTIAVDLEDRPFREDDGSILFRPAGHGALIQNLDDINADLVFIKNIDNVVPDRIKNTTYTYKKILGALLIEHKNKIHNYLELIEGGKANLDEVLDYMKNEIGINFNNSFNSETDKADFIKTKLNRPIRVCGMVVNTGEPGGGPFYCQNADGTESLQIVESSQMDLTDPEQKKIVDGATHFNPVDLVCWLKNYKGEAFNLLDYVDHATGFISSKSKNGRDLKAMELPGLWNGSMADWITIFVEVPEITFNPVKTVNDLLRENHQ